jgi:cytochrome c oxidase subunit 1
MADHTTETDADGRAVTGPAAVRLARGWLGLGVLALALAGVFAILLVLARSPGLAWLFPTQGFFRTALVVHVDQSILIWFLAFAGVLWGLAPGTRPALSRLGLVGATLGCLLVAASPFLGASARELNNYVPVLDAPVFFWGLALFALGSLAQVTAYLTGALARVRLADPVAVGTATAAVATLIAAASLVWSWIDLAQTGTSAGMSYELLFWGPGHVLQFVYTQIMLVAWLWLARDLGRPLALPDRWLSALLMLGVLPLLSVPLIQALYAPGTGEARLAFTRLMQFGNGLAVVPLGLLLAVTLLHRRAAPPDPELHPQYRALTASLTLFAAGGVLAVAISGVNTIIPAHYHGSIVGVTLALMGLTYHLLPTLGLPRPTGWMARSQPWIYASGQLLHIGGLAVSGAMGIQRKTAGAAQGLDTWQAKAAMGVMGIGGLLAVIGGILFVLVVIRAFMGRTRPQP